MFDEVNRGVAQAEPVYSPAARFFHWLVALLVVVMAVTGLVMTARGEADIWDALTNNLYSTHKALGLSVLAVVVLRLLYRLFAGAPPHEPTLAPWERLASHTVHWLIYLLLIVIPIGGWIGVSLFPALDLFGGAAKIPALASPDNELSKLVLEVHGIAAYTLFALVAIHVAAALYHHFVRGDGVLARMLPSVRRRV